ncbi:hypothetical protein [Burkholderia phage FLC9]|nr:hypothetical protein [Burkholderia phage FLC9]
MGKIYCDFEFNSYKGEVMSVGLVKENGEALYNVFPKPKAPINPWVARNVVPYLDQAPSGIWAPHLTVEEFQQVLQAYLQKEEDEIRIVTDWPDDVKYLSELLITGPGTMVNIPGIVFEVKRVDAYSYARTLDGAVQHHALWDALQLRYCLTDNSDYKAFQPT